MALLAALRIGIYLARALPEALKSDQGEYHKIASHKLRALVKHAYGNVDLYRQKYDQAGVKPDDIRTIGDLEKLPIITKQDLIGGFPEAILARNIRPEDCQMVATSGSTGTPIKVFKERVLVERRCLVLPLLHLALRRRTGKKLRPGMLCIFVTSPDSLEATVASEMARLPRFLNRHFHWIDALDDPHVHLQALAQYRPDTISTYPSVLRNIAVVAREEGLSVHQPKMLLVSGEVIDANSRQVISSVFKGEMMSYYATTEAGLIAMECRCHQGLHVRADEIVLEARQEGRSVPPGVPGSAVVTNLGNRATPIIRYSGLGDIVVFADKPCACGSRLPLLRAVEGRIVDSLVLPGGKLVHPYSLTLALEHIPTIAQFQVIQERLDRVRVLIVPEKNSDHSAFGENGHLRDKVLQNLREILREGVYINIEMVKDIPRREHAYRGTVISLVQVRLPKNG